MSEQSEREAVAKAMQQTRVRSSERLVPWEDVDHAAKERYRDLADAAIAALRPSAAPPVDALVEALRKIEMAAQAGREEGWSGGAVLWRAALEGISRTAGLALAQHAERETGETEARYEVWQGDIRLFKTASIADMLDYADASEGDAEYPVLLKVATTTRVPFDVAQHAERVGARGGVDHG